MDIYIAKVPHSKIKISFEHAILNVLSFETVTKISRSISPDVCGQHEKKPIVWAPAVRSPSSKHMVFLCKSNAQTASLSERGCILLLLLLNVPVNIFFNLVRIEAL